MQCLQVSESARQVPWGGDGAVVKIAHSLWTGLELVAGGKGILQLLLHRNSDLWPPCFVAFLMISGSALWPLFAAFLSPCCG